MKKFFAIIATALLVIANHSVALAETPEEAKQLDNAAAEMYNNGDFDHAIETYVKELSILKNEYHEADSHCIEVRNRISLCYTAKKDYSKAVEIGKTSLDLLKENFGTHDMRYINQLSALRSIYVEKGEKSIAKSISELQDKLNEERTYGFVPEMVAFKNAEQCAKSNNDAYYCCVYYLNNNFKAKNMQQAASYILSWVRNTNDTEILATSQMKSWMSERNMAYIVAFMAANAEYSLRYGNDRPKDQYANSIVRLLKYYNGNKQRIGTVDLFEQYTKMYQNDPQSLFAYLSKDYDNACQTRTLSIMR